MAVRSPPEAPPDPAPSSAAPPPLRREGRRRALGGVCAGIAQRLGIDPLIPRLAFLAAAVSGGVGIVLYGLAWALIPLAGSDRSVAGRVRGRAGTWQVIGGIALLTLAGLLLFRELGLWFSDAIVWPVLLAAVGGALIWRQSSEGSDPSRRSVGARASISRRLSLTGALRRSAGPALVRVGLGVALVVGAGLLFLLANDALAPARDAVLAVLVVLVSLALILAPWWWRLGRNLAGERAERIRSQERAELAAHLHDSVLQTLALMQRRADDPRSVASLARRQERELRAWLSGRAEPRAAASIAAALEAMATEVEEGYDALVDAVTVGDVALDGRGEALVAAAREAVVNAAKFAGEGPISVYAELDPERAHVFVRDRGPGFDTGGVPADRRGVRESIVGRMERAGGRALVHAAPEGGTEVELSLDLGRS